MLTMTATGVAQQARKSGQTIESRSAPFATELAQLLAAQNLSNVAAKSAENYVGAFYQPGIQLLVVSAKLADGERFNYLLAQKDYKEAYRDLNSATMVSTRMLISDLGANGLHFRREKDQPFDMVDIAGKSMLFNGEWGGKEKPSRDEYEKTYATTDEQYSQMLQALISTLKKPS
jgi:hypothetical protein